LLNYHLPSQSHYPISLYKYHIFFSTNVILQNGESHSVSSFGNMMLKWPAMVLNASMMLLHPLGQLFHIQYMSISGHLTCQIVMPLGPNNVQHPTDHNYITYYKTQCSVCHCVTDIPGVMSGQGFCQDSGWSTVFRQSKDTGGPSWRGIFHHLFHWQYHRGIEGREGTMCVGCVGAVCVCVCVWHANIFLKRHTTPHDIYKKKQLFNFINIKVFATFFPSPFY
jgi:hypothetical protein